MAAAADEAELYGLVRQIALRAREDADFRVWGMMMMIVMNVKTLPNVGGRG